MSERGNFRGRGAGGGRGGRGGTSDGSRGGRGGHSQAGSDKPKKENILDLTKYMDKEISVKFNGGREGAFFWAAFEMDGRKMRKVGDVWSEADVCLRE